MREDFSLPPISPFYQITLKPLKRGALSHRIFQVYKKSIFEKTIHKIQYFYTGVVTESVQSLKTRFLGLTTKALAKHDAS